MPLITAYVFILATAGPLIARLAGSHRLTGLSTLRPDPIRDG